MLLLYNTVLKIYSQLVYPCKDQSKRERSLLYNNTVLAIALSTESTKVLWQDSETSWKRERWGSLWTPLIC